MLIYRHRKQGGVHSQSRPPVIQTWLEDPRRTRDHILRIRSCHHIKDANKDETFSGTWERGGCVPFCLLNSPSGTLRAPWSPPVPPPQRGTHCTRNRAVSPVSCQWPQVCLSLRRWDACVRSWTEWTRACRRSPGPSCSGTRMFQSTLFQRATEDLRIAVMS